MRPRGSARARGGKKTFWTRIPAGTEHVDIYIHRTPLRERSGIEGPAGEKSALGRRNWRRAGWEKKKKTRITEPPNISSSLSQTSQTHPQGPLPERNRRSISPTQTRTTPPFPAKSSQGCTSAGQTTAGEEISSKPSEGAVAKEERNGAQSQ